MFASSLLTLLLATCTFAIPTSTGRRCGTSQSEAERFLSNSRSAGALKQMGEPDRTPGEGLPSPRGNGPTNITVYWHVIQKGENVTEGHVTARGMDLQMEALNNAYRQTNIQFVLAGSDYTTNASWFNYLTKETWRNDDMKKALRKGDKTTLNLYSTGFAKLDKGFLGYSPFPDLVNSKLWDDGIVFRWSSIPGGSMPNYNLGHTLTHEVGHWLGLLHTFEGGCVENGDGVDDTPAQMNPTDGCPIERNSCPGLPGIDPIHNYMDYSYDICLNNFTPGQARRIKEQIRLHRGIIVAPTPFDEGPAGIKTAQTHFNL